MSTRAIKRDHAGNQVVQIFMLGAYVVRKRHLAFAIMRSDKAAFLSEAQFYETVIPNDNLLETEQFVLIKGLSACLANGAAPTLNTILGGGRSPSMA